MNNILEKACSKKLHWTKETIREYIVNHAHEVNHEIATKYANNPPPLPENDDDKWFKQHSKLPGSGKAPRKQLQLKTLKKKGRAKGGAKKLPPDQQRNCHQTSSRKRSHTGIDQAQWPCGRLGDTRSPLNYSSGSCHSRDW